MRTSYRNWVAALLLYLFTTPLSTLAAQYSFGAGAGAVFHVEEWAPALSLEYSQGLGVPGLVADAGLDVLFFPGDPDPRYYRDQFSNGQSRCRDSETGQFVTDAHCINVDTRAAVRLAGMYQAAGWQVAVGGGVRISNDGINPIAAAAYERGPLIWRLVAGPKYFQANIGFFVDRRREER